MAACNMLRWSIERKGCSGGRCSSRYSDLDTLRVDSTKQIMGYADTKAVPYIQMCRDQAML
jgi:hypothetical protein